MFRPCVSHRAALAGLAIALASSAPVVVFANVLPPEPVMGHAPEYVIVTPAPFAGEFQSLAKAKTRLGIPALVRTVEAIRTDYPGGRDDAERVRMFLQDAHSQWGVRWVLLGGMPPLVPARRVRTRFVNEADYVTDLYFAALQGTWDADGDGIFGEAPGGPSDPGDEVDLHTDVFVGRAPVRTRAEAHDFVAKLLAPIGDTSAPNRLLLGADVYIPVSWSEGQPIQLDGAVIAETAAPPAQATPGVEIDRLYQNWSDPRWPDATPWNRDALLAALNAGADLLVAANRGGPLTMTAGPDSVTAADLGGLGAAARPTQAWIFGSSTGNFEGDCLAAAFVRGASGGAMGCVAPSGLVFLGGIQFLLPPYVQALYPPRRATVGEALGSCRDSQVLNAGFDGPTRQALEMLNLLGDPEARLRFPVPHPIAVTLAAQISAGPSGFDVDVRRGGEPVAGARVCAMIDEVALSIAFTDDAGRAHLEFPEGSSGLAEITVSTDEGDRFEDTRIVTAVTAVGPDGRVRTRLDAPSPNPAFGEVRFGGAVGAEASIDVHDVSGRRVRSFAIGAGAFAMRWDLRDEDGRRVPSGLYFVRLRSSGGTQLQRLVVGR